MWRPSIHSFAVEKAMYWNDTGGAIWAGGTGVTATLLPPRPVVH